MKKLFVLLLTAVLISSCSAPQHPFFQESSKSDWVVLFDGTSTDGWRGFNKDKLPAGWEITAAGELFFNGQKGGGDIMTKDEFEDFELELSWKISPGGNSGIFFWVSEDAKAAYLTGPEMQVLDNLKHKDGKNAKTSAGANYALHAAPRNAVKKVGAFNKVRLVAVNNHIEHWLNGKKIVEYTIGDADWKALVAASKFRKMPRYGSNRKGHIVLQDHGDKVWYKNIRIRRLEYGK